LTRPVNTKQLRFYLTAPAPCPYLPGKRERKVFTALEGDDSYGLHDALTHAGFRRSQNIAYRPACEGCDACVSARVPTQAFTWTRSRKKILARNDDLSRTFRKARATEEQYWLLRRYLDHRHAGGGMAEMTAFDYAAMVEESAVATGVIEYRDAGGTLVAAALVDMVSDGLSMVYSYFDPTDPSRSLGTFLILDAIRQCARAEVAFVYLGYWVRGSAKMDYKIRFQPLELLSTAGWVDHAAWLASREG
jgi:leucyl-tRNA---protein transferase